MNSKSESTSFPKIPVGVRGNAEVGGKLNLAMQKRTSSTASSGLGRPPKHGISTRDRLITGAGRLTKICGVWVGVEPICVAADAPKSSLYSVLGGKSKLMAACCEAESEEMQQLLIAHAEKASDPENFLKDLIVKIGAAHSSEGSQIGVSARILQTAPTDPSYNDLPEALEAARSTVNAWPSQLKEAILKSGGQCLDGFDRKAKEFFRRFALSIISAGIFPEADTCRDLANEISELGTSIVFSRGSKQPKS